MATPATSPWMSPCSRLFAPKPIRAADCQGCGMPDLGIIVHWYLLVSVVVGGDCYSVGYSGSSRSFGWLGRSTSEATTFPSYGGTTDPLGQAIPLRAITRCPLSGPSGAYPRSAPGPPVRSLSPSVRRRLGSVP